MSSRVDRRLWLVRHGETEGRSSVRLHGKTDVPLAELGREQVRRLLGELTACAFDAVVHSPLARARESAAILVAGLRAQPAVVEAMPALSEVDFGALEGMTVDEVAAAMPDWHRRWVAGVVDAYPGGEVVATFRARVARAFRELVARHPRGDVLVVAHKGVLRAGIESLCGLDFGSLRKRDMDLGSLWVLRSGAPWTLERENVTG